MVSKESSGAVLMKFTAMYTKTATDHVTKMALGMAIAQYLQRARDAAAKMISKTGWCLRTGMPLRREYYWNCRHF